MTGEKIDRRVRKTRALLQEGLFRLMQEKEIKDISVKELSDLVDINRGTFYLHYTDIYDMLHKIEEELFTEFDHILERSLSEKEPTDSPRDTLLEIFRYLERHYDVAKVMIGPHGDFTFVNGMKNLVQTHLQHIFADDGLHSEYHTSFIVSGYVGVIETWLKQPDRPSAEEMAELCSHINV